MKKEEIIEILNDIFLDIFELEKSVLDETEDLFEMENWDSLNQVRLIATVENEFNIKVTEADINNFKSFRTIVDFIYSKFDSK